MGRVSRNRPYLSGGLRGGFEQRPIPAWAETTPIGILGRGNVTLKWNFCFLGSNFMLFYDFFMAFFHIL